MNKKSVLFFALTVCLITLSIFGCGQSTPTPTPTPTPSGTISLTGTLASGTVSSTVLTAASGLKIQAVASAAIPSYTVVALGKNNGGVYYADSATDSSGNFKISNLPSGESFYVEILDSSSQLAAPVGFSSSAGKVIMAITPEATFTMETGTIVFDSSKSAAAPSTAPTSFLDTNAQARVKNGETVVPVGAGNIGKGTGEAKYSGTYDPTKNDGDLDGLPNNFDADLNGDGYVNEIDGLYTMEAFTKGGKSNNGSQVYVFSNLKVDYEFSNTFQASQYLHLAMGVMPRSDKINSVASVYLVSGPSCISKMKIFSVPGTTQEPVPVEGTVWSTTSYKLYKSLLSGPGSTPQWTVSVNGVTPYVNGSGDLKAGDVFKFKITYTDGSYEYLTKMLNFIYTDIPRLYKYSFDKGATWKDPPPITQGTSIIDTAPTSEITLKWTRPKDENSLDITGSEYTYEYSPAKGRTDVPEIVQIAMDTSTATYLQSTQDFAGLLDPGTFLIGICARDPANDNAAQNLRFNRSGW